MDKVSNASSSQSISDKLKCIQSNSENYSFDFDWDENMFERMKFIKMRASRVFINLIDLFSFTWPKQNNLTKANTFHIQIKYSFGTAKQSDDAGKCQCVGFSWIFPRRWTEKQMCKMNYLCSTINYIQRKLWNGMGIC